MRGYAFLLGACLFCKQGRKKAHLCLQELDSADDSDRKLNLPETVGQFQTLLVATVVSRPKLTLALHLGGEAVPLFLSGLGVAVQTARSRRTGKKMMADTRESAPSTAMPTTRKGSSSSHTMGYRTIATSASGQQKNSSRHQRRNFSIRNRSSARGQDFLFISIRLRSGCGSRLWQFTIEL